MRHLKASSLAASTAALLLAALLTGCRVGESPAAAYPGPLVGAAARSTASPAVTAYPGPPARTPFRATARPSGAATPSPAATAAAGAPAATPAPTRADIAFALSILHTGEVRGEVLPCG